LRFPLKVSSLIVGLGMLLTLAAAGSGLADGQQGAAPSDLLIDAMAGSGQPRQDFAPAAPPQEVLAGPRVDPTLLPPTSGPQQPVPAASPASATPQPPLSIAPTPSLTAVPVYIPDRLVIPAIALDARVITSTQREVMAWGTLYQQWLAPDEKAAGWQASSAPLGAAGNTVLSGHHNIFGEVFRHLADLEEGDLIWVYSDARSFAYRIVLVTILPERWQPMDVRLANAQWILPSQDERLTLITCWPYASNTHRLVIVAMPVDLNAIEAEELIPRVTPRPPSN
jgi:LPXTG-site transpeptidase (sortase) family protein